MKPSGIHFKKGTIPGFQYDFFLDFDNEQKMIVAWDPSKLKRIHNIDTDEEMLVYEK